MATSSVFFKSESKQAPAGDLNRYLNSLLPSMRAEIERTHNFTNLLPLLFRFNGDPVTLISREMFEPCFKVVRPRRQLLMCGRQVGKSFQRAIEMLMRAVIKPYWNQLFVTPLQEQAKKFSQNYIKPLIEESAVKRLMQKKGGSSRVFSRQLANGSTQYFSYAGKDANRTRGINANEVIFDEFQLMFEEVMHVIQHTMDGSKYGRYEAYSGTPLSFGNVLTKYWYQTSMSEWVITCRHCGFENVPSFDKHLFKMIGPPHAGIHIGGVDLLGKKRKRTPGLVCARCSPRNKGIKALKHIYPEDGHWMHKVPELRESFLGLHIPQPITQLHAYDANRWAKLTSIITAGNTSEIMNEIMGEPCDSGFKPISEREMRRAACLGHKNRFTEAIKKIQRGGYAYLAMGVDWGGGGVSGHSRTKAALVGITTTGKTDVLFGCDFGALARVNDEVQMLRMYAEKAGVQFFAHDAGGGVGFRQAASLAQSGLSPRKIYDMCYSGVIKGALIKPQDIQLPGETPTYSVARSKSLTFLCQAIKQGHVRFFDYDYQNTDNPGLLHDFLSLTTDIDHNPKGSDRLIVDKEDNLSDDFVHAVNLACMVLWFKSGAYPQLSNDLYREDLFANLGGDEFLQRARDLTPAEIEEIAADLSFSIGT